MKPTFEKLGLRAEQSFRCFDRRVYRLPARWHRHPEIELTYVPRGGGARHVGDSIETYSDHDLVLLGSNLPHTWVSDEYRGKRVDMHEAIVMQFHPDFLGNHFFQVAEMRPINELLERSNRGVWLPPAVAKEIGQTMRSLTEMTGPARLITLLDILYRVAQATPSRLLASPGFATPASSASESRIQMVSDYTQKHFTDPEFTVGQLAEKLKMNPSAFSRFFRQSTGQTPSAYLNELRIGYACRRLLDSDSSILQIAHESGFASTSNFNETFRRLRRMSPREYRMRNRQLA